VRDGRFGAQPVVKTKTSMGLGGLVVVLVLVSRRGGSPGAIARNPPHRPRHPPP
jgi:hypothetical protein